MEFVIIQACVTAGPQRRTGHHNSVEVEALKTQAVSGPLFETQELTRYLGRITIGVVRFASLTLLSGN